MVTKNGSTEHPFLYVDKYGYYAHYQDEAVLPYITASLSDKKPSFLQTGARQYFPKPGIYLQEDPAQDGLNWFAYCNNDPINKINPNGKQCYRCWRGLEGMDGAFSSITWHAFIWCDNEPIGYDDSDVITDFHKNSFCDDRDKKFLKDEKLRKQYGLKCKKLDKKLTSCLIQKAKENNKKECFEKFNLAFNNCQEYSQSLIDECKKSR